MAVFHLTIYQDRSGVIRMKRGTAREWDMTATAEYTYKLGNDSTIIHLVRLDLTPEEIQQLAARALSGLDD